MELFDGEEISVKNEPIPPALLTDESINSRYISGEVRIVTEQARYPLNTILGMVKGKNYTLNPEFQRRHRWDDYKKSKLIESLIMNVPIPPVFLYEVKFSYYEVMDGLQRLSTIADFYADKFELRGLQEWSELNGRKYSSLPENIREGIDRRHISSIILLTETAKDPAEAQRLKQLVFERINSGGVKLEGQETRNAIYNGPLNQLCIKLARNIEFCKMWGLPLPDESEISNGVPADERLTDERFRKMEDVELVLRFFAYRQFDRSSGVGLDTYLDYFLERGNSFGKDLLEKYSDLFNNTISLVYNVLGEEAFFIIRDQKSTQRPTKFLFETITTVFSGLLDKKDILIQNREKIKAGLSDLYRDNSDKFAGRAVNKTDVQARRSIFADYINQFLV